MSDSVPAQRRPLIDTGSPAFIAVLALCTTVTALGIDTILPAYAAIRAALSLPEGSSAVTGLISTYFIGSSLGLLPAGLLSDRFGRKNVMWVGLVIYFVGAVAAAFAPTLETMLVARFVWGLGAAGPRVAALAMIRDVFEGAQMARVMSFAMAVFILVPTFAPALGTLILHISNWQMIFWVCAGAAVVVAGMVSRLPNTLAPENRRQLDAREILNSIGVVLRTPGTVGYMVSLSALFSAFLSYLASSEPIIDQVFDMAAQFPLVFGGISLFLGAGMLINGRLVERLGLQRMIGMTFGLMGAAACAMLLASVLNGGRPSAVLFLPPFALTLMFTQMLLPNLNSAAMVPLAAVAGTGAAMLGMVSGVVGSIFGGVVDRAFDGSVTPISVAFVVAVGVALAGWRFAEHSRARASQLEAPAALDEPQPDPV